eukprot:604426_1
MQPVMTRRMTTSWPIETQSSSNMWSLVCSDKVKGREFMTALYLCRWREEEAQNVAKIAYCFSGISDVKVHKKKKQKSKSKSCKPKGKSNSSTQSKRRTKLKSKCCKQVEHERDQTENRHKKGASTNYITHFLGGWVFQIF